MTDDEIGALNAELAQLTGKARTVPLLRLGKAHAERHWRIGPGQPGALPDLQKGVRAFEEAYGYMPADDAYRGQAAFMLGFLRGTRLTAYPGVGPADDGDAAIKLIEEGLSFPNVQPTLAAMGRFMMGQLYLTRAMQGFQSHDVMASALRGGAAPPGARADADRAVDCFRKVIDASTIAEMTQLAQMMLTMAEVMQTMLSGFGSGLGGFDMGKMLDSVTKLQQFQQTGFKMRMPTVGLPAPTSILNFGSVLAGSDPLDRPVVFMPGTQPEEPEADQPPPLARPQQLTPDADAMRQDLRKLLSAGDDTDDVYASTVSLLRSNQSPEFLDELVALSTSVVYGAGETTGTDHFLLAAALYLRDRRDHVASAQDAEPSLDAQDAIASLTAAARRLSHEAPDRMPAVLFLATLLTTELPTDLTDQFTDIAAAARAAGADALKFPAPADALRLNAATGQIEPADAPSDATNLIVIGTQTLTESAAADDDNERVASAYPTLTRLIERSRSERRLTTQQPVFLANPRGDRMAAAADVMLLRRSFYPRSRGFGHLIEDVNGAGTTDEIRSTLNCSLLHLACGITESGALQLANGTELDLAQLSPIADHGLAILPPGQLQPLADRLFALGFDDVIGWRRPVPEPIATVILYLLHAELAENGRSPATAVARVRRWPRDPARDQGSQLPTGYAERLEQATEHHWTALVHLGA